MKITSLKDHDLLKEVTKICSAYLAKRDEINNGDSLNLIGLGIYATDTMLSVSNVVSCIDQLHFSVDMLSGYRAEALPEKMNRYDYIVYGIENYYLRLTSIHDRCLRLANIIFNLGLPNRHCNNATIIHNSHIKGTEVANSLKALDKFTNPFRSHRNAVAHEATYSEESLAQLGLLHHFLDEDESWINYRYPAKKMTDEFVANKKTEFHGNLEELELLVTNYFDSINPFFIQKLGDILKGGK
ncbi:MAG: Cthe_2314 family HEPN domain-containing protein [Chloroflexota bacterium]